MNYWHRAAKQPKFFFVLDWRVSFFFFILIFHMRFSTLLLLVAVSSILSILNYFGYSINVFYNKTRSLLAGDVRYSRPFWYMNRFVR